MDYKELIERMRKKVINPFDLGPVADAIESLLNALDVAEGEVKRTAAERDAALAELAKYRDAPVVAYLYKYHNCFGDEVWSTDHNLGNRTPFESKPLIVKPDENQ